MSETLTIGGSDHGSVKVLHLAGKLDGQTQAALMDVARRAHAAGTRCLLIDLTDVDFIAVAGLGALQILYQMFTPRSAIEAWDSENHGEPYKSAYLKLAGASPSVHYVLNIAGFLQNIPIYLHLDQALESFR